MKKFLVIFLMLFSILQTLAFEDYILSTDGVLSEIRVENKDVIKIEPLVTIDNSKNTLFITPLKKGETGFSVLKNGNQKYDFKVSVLEDKAVFSEVEGFDIVGFDIPPVIWDYQIDLPPVFKNKNNSTTQVNIDGVAVDTSVLNENEGE